MAVMEEERVTDDRSSEVAAVHMRLCNPVFRPAGCPHPACGQLLTAWRQFGASLRTSPCPPSRFYDGGSCAFYVLHTHRSRHTQVCFRPGEFFRVHLGRVLRQYAQLFAHELVEQ